MSPCVTTLGHLLTYSFGKVIHHKILSLPGCLVTFATVGKAPELLVNCCGMSTVLLNVTESWLNVLVDEEREKERHMQL